MNQARAKMQSELRKNVEQERIEEATRKWKEVQGKVAKHKRSDKPRQETVMIRRNKGYKQEMQIHEER